jgi:cytochrome c oxidase subunit II
MGRVFPVFPEQASTVASRVDALYIFLLALSAFFSILIFTAVIVFAVRYRRRSEAERPPAILGSIALELVWSLIPLAICGVIFVWSLDVFFAINRVPPQAMDIYVVGKRWMWKAQHLTGQREINELHVPVGVPVRLTLTSEDVIHSFFVPAFRVKKDAVPGRYTTLWFEATRPGTYHLFCAEYCGTKHSAMIGSVTVMEPAAFQSWLSGGASGVSLATAGERRFQELGCVTCHRAGEGQRGPALEGLFGKPVKLVGGGAVTADETYIRESIVTPSARVVEGYQPVMPTYQGLVDEEGLMQLVAYVRSLGTQPAAGGQPGAAGVGTPGTSPPGPGGASPSPPANNQEPRP